MRISMKEIWRNLDGPPKNKELWSYVVKFDFSRPKVACLFLCPGKQMILAKNPTKRPITFMEQTIDRNTLWTKILSNPRKDPATEGVGGDTWIATGRRRLEPETTEQKYNATIMELETGHNNT